MVAGRPRADAVIADLDDHLRASLGAEEYDQLADLLTRAIACLPTWTSPADA